jgi:hypothetical protein
MPVVTGRWKSVPTMTEGKRRHIVRIQELRKASLTAAHVVEIFTWWRLIPLKNRTPNYTYTGLMDPNKESVEGIPPFTDVVHVRYICT